MAEKFDLSIDQGSTFTSVVEYVTDTGAVIPLTGYSARMQFRTSYDAASPALSLTEGAGLVTNGAAGSVTITVAAAATASIPAKDYLYDLEVFNGAGDVKRLIEGVAMIRPEVTR